MPQLKIITRKPERLFVIGDLHGCCDEATVLLEFLRVEQNVSAKDQVIFIGDYIDRGPASSSVIELLLAWQRDFPHTVFLKGNHEEMLLEYLADTTGNVDQYLFNGGETTLLSYGVVDVKNVAESASLIPESHINFLKSLEHYIELSEFVFAHAGLDPLKPLTRQDAHDLLWIRDEFIENIHQFEKIVVFGHTPYEDVFLDMPYKIGVDTGLVFGNMLSCCELVHGDVFQVKAGQKEIIRSHLHERLK